MSSYFTMTGFRATVCAMSCVQKAQGLITGADKLDSD